MEKWILQIVLLGLLMPAGSAQKPSPPSQVSGGPAESAGRHPGNLESRGDEALGFRKAVTTRHFRLWPDGGVIEVEADDPSDAATRNAVRAYLGRIAGMFSEGNFSMPMFIHDTPPPGVDTMKQMGGKITYQAEDTIRGARVRILSSDPAALRAIYDFLRFEIADHRTGDPLEVQPPKPKRPRPGDNLGRDTHPAIN